MTPDHLDVDRLLASPLAADVEYYARLDSTNDRAKEHLATGTGKRPLLVVAEEQSSGRGRGGNRWWTGRGSLAFSLLLDAAALRIQRVQSPLVALASAVAVVEAVRPFLPAHPLGIRWPNDTYVGNRKLAGVLVEVPSPDCLVVGIGLNVNNTLADAPTELAAKVTTLWELTHVARDRTTVLLELLDHLARLLEQLASTPEAVASRADALCLQHDRRLTIDQGQCRTTGRCIGIARDGALLLETSLGPKAIYSGIVREEVSC